MVWTTAMHAQCAEGSLYVDTRGEVTCSVCGEDDVPTMREITAAVQADEILRVCPNGLLRRTLVLSWGTSRGRETYGYTIARLDDTTTGKRYRCSGGGYDMVGTVLADWLEDTYPRKLAELARTDAHAVYSAAGGYKSDGGAGKLYGLTYYSDDDRARLDGACGVSSVARVARALGLDVRPIVNRRGHTAGFTVDGPDQ